MDTVCHAVLSVLSADNALMEWSAASVLLATEVPSAKAAKLASTNLFPLPSRASLVLHR